MGSLVSTEVAIARMQSLINIVTWLGEFLLFDFMSPVSQASLELDM